MKNLALAILFVLCPLVCFAQEAPKPNYVLLRTGGGSPFLATYNRTFGQKVVWFGTLQDEAQAPAYREWQVGLGHAVGASQAFGIVLHANDGWYFQPAFVPNITVGMLSVQGFVGVYLPLESQGMKQLLIDPVTVLAKLSDKVSVGGSYTCWKPAGGDKHDAVGPTLQIQIPKGSINADLFEGISGNYRREMRLTLQLNF